MKKLIILFLLVPAVLVLTAHPALAAPETRERLALPQLAPPDPFGKASPADGAADQARDPTLSWDASTGADSYEYCYDTTDDDSCTTWIDNGASTSIALSGLSTSTTYYWHVRALNVDGTTYSDAGEPAFWSFTTLPDPPGAFGKSGPSDGAVDQPTDPTLSWGSSAGAASYEYCIDTTNNDACSGWTDNGASTSVSLNGLSAGATYYWHVRAVNAGGQTYSDNAPTAFWSFTTLPDAPGAFNKTTPADGAVDQSTSPTLNWGASSGADSYEYCIDTTDDNDCSNWTDVGASTSVSLNGLSTGATYYWHVRANNAGGTTYSNSNTFWSFTTLPNPPGAFNKTSPADGAVDRPLNPTLSWGASSGAVSYEYCYDTTNNDACSNWINNGASTSKTLSGLSTSTTYYWHVRALNAGGTTYSNASATAFWSFTTVPNPPGAFNKTGPADGAVNQSLTPTLTWAPSAGAASYAYCIDTTNNGNCSTWVDNGASTSKALSGLSPSTTYYWHVRASSAGGTTYSNGNTFWSFTTIPNAPGAFNKTAPAAGAVNQSLTPSLSWGASTGATSYEYCYDTSNDNACSAWIGNGTATGVALSGLSRNTTYYWHVRANNAGGTTYSNGLSTAFFSFTTIPDPPGAFNKTGPANGAINQPTSLSLVWSASAGATAYEFCYDTSNDNACSTWTSNGPATSKALSNLNAGTTYYWHVRALNPGGTTYSNGGSATAFWNFKTQGVAVGDGFEPDNTPPLARFITAGATQTHSIFPSSDVDWVKFELASPSAVTLETSGQPGHDTRMWLYNSSLVQIRFNDDKNIAQDILYSYINTCDLAPLPAGTYYVKVDEFENNAEIPSYTLSFQTGKCVNISVAGASQGFYMVPTGGSTRQSLPGVNNGPVKITGLNTTPIIGAERVIYKVRGVNTSFSEMMGLPDSQLDNVYWLPWYNNLGLDTQLRFANVGNATATVQLFIGGVEKTSGCTPSNGPYTLAAGASLRVSCTGVDSGPVEIRSTQNLVAAERVIYKVNGVHTSFSEIMALPEKQLDNVYWLPWYNNVGLDTQLRFANVSSSPATVQLFIGGVEKTSGCTPSSSPYTLQPGASLRVSCTGVDSGPVEIRSTQNIVAAERVIYKVNGVYTSFSEMMALPDNRLDTTYWLPWYNNLGLDTQLRFANVGTALATVHLYIGGVERTTGCTPTGSPYTLEPGESLRVSCPGLDSGPVQIVSDQPIVAAERVIYKVNGVQTSFSEMMGLPASLLDDLYWLPWYNNLDLDTQLRFGVP